tara:strand:- start:695 stop:1192 length:498 start_codon:yes stop_codon:yes gene_type:complete
MNAITKTNSVAKTVVNNAKNVPTKKVVKRKPQTEAQKQATAKKRALNPQWANVQSAKRKTEKGIFKTNPIACLIEVKRTASLTNVNVDSHKNLDYQKQCKIAINFMVKNKTEFLPLLENAVTKIKGNFNVYRFEQLIQRIVKLKIEKNFDFKTSLNAIISENSLK